MKISPIIVQIRLPNITRNGSIDGGLPVPLIVCCFVPSELLNIDMETAPVLRELKNSDAPRA
jgi:hypothetical protein